MQTPRPRLASNPIRFADMATAHKPRFNDISDRFDPFYTGLFRLGSQLAWSTRASAERMHAVGYLVPARDLSVSPDAALASILASPRRPVMIRILACLASFRTLTAEQLGALLDDGSLGARSGILLTMWQAGLVERGALGAAFQIAVPALKRQTLYRVTPKTAAWAQLMESLTFEETCLIHGGRPVSAGTRSDRHNILAAALAISAAELCHGVVAVAGESQSQPDLLRLDGTPAPRWPRHADALIVREDGMVVCIELTATVSKMAEKTDAWARFFAEADEDVAVRVVFVLASNPDIPSTSEKAVFAEVRKQIASSIFSRTTASAFGAQRKMVVARWRDWFPEPGCASEAFRFLEGWMPSGDKHAGERLWQKVALLDPVDTPFDSTDPARDAAFISSFQILVSTPAWLLNGPRPVMDWTALLERQATNRRPTVALLKPEMADIMWARRQAIAAGLDPSTGPRAPLPEGRLDLANKAASRNRRRRAGWLLDVCDPDTATTVQDLFEFAATEEGIPLRKLTLRSVLLAEPDASTRGVTKTLARLGTQAHINSAEKLTVGWLLDNRAPRRWSHWLRVTELRDLVPMPWTNWPYAADDGEPARPVPKPL